MHAVDYLIVGQGLAGSCLALELMRQGVSFLVVDQIEPNSASRVAAGLFNPITGKTMQSTWRATELFPFMLSFYKQAQQDLGTQFLYEMPIVRPFVSESERNQWRDTKHPFVSKVELENLYQPFINYQNGYLELNHCGFLETSIFLASIRQRLKEQNALLEESFSFDQLSPSQSIYKTVHFKKLIFCEGIRVDSNPFFNWVPVKKLKGETMLIRTKLPRNLILNRGVFAVPTSDDDTFLVGSTYSHDAQPGNTEAGLSELKSKTAQLLRCDYEIVATNWGHRPTSPDRRPILGCHPIHQNLLIFNGLGTKGVSLAPFFAVHLSNYFEGKTELDKAVNIERFYSLSFQNQGEGKAE